MSWKTSSTIHDKPGVNDIAVAILNWNGIHYLQEFLPNVVANSENDANIWIIDNGSKDNSVQWVEQHFPQVNILLNGDNYGFARGYNEGLRRIDAKYFVLLNSDVEVTQNWIPPVIQFMERDQMAACQPKIRDYNRREWFEHAGATGGFIDRFGYVFCAGRIFDAFEKDAGQYEDNKEVFWASGAALFIRSDAWDEVGGLDEDFFAHMEEIDLCWRLKNKGYRIGACGQSTVYHVGGGTLDKLNPFKTYLNFRNNLFILVKNYHDGSLWWLLLRRMLLDGIAGIRFLSEGKLSYTRAVLRAHGSFYRQYRTMCRKRETLSINRTPNRCGWYKRSIIYDYYFLKKDRFNKLDPSDFHHS